ncbi:MAG: hydrogenase formation protein HypD [Cyanobacteriota bacterium]|nr:hydrogenase formation protein HypD [Cyanobacteriota bacterium]
MVAALAEALRRRLTRPWTVMEVCGGQTHAIVRSGLDQLLPDHLRLIHGPGCPVCVTPTAILDRAMALAGRPEVMLCSYGDMLRVPGSQPGSDLLAVRAAGGDVRLLTTPLQALALARRHPDRQVVLLAVGFETTAPATALLARQALAVGVTNLSLLVAHVRVVPAMAALLEDPACSVQGFLAAGHVCAVTGTAELEALVRLHRRPVVVTGFTPPEILRGLLACVQQLEQGQAAVVNAYGQVVRADGNPQARALLEAVFEPVDLAWRGLGLIAGGGLMLRPAYAALDASRRLDGAGSSSSSDGGSPTAPCISDLVLQGRAHPCQCPAFAKTCTPHHPLGVPMVSDEGACAAWFRYRR